MPRNYRPMRRKRKKVIKKRNINMLRRQLRPTANRPAVHLFRRAFTKTLALSNVTAPAGWTAEGNAIYSNFSYKLNDLLSATDFTNLFQQYKINGVKQELIFSNTSSMDTNSQLLVYWDANKDGQSRTRSEQTFLDSQTSKHVILKPPSKQKITLYTKLKQLSNTFKLTDDDYAVVNPRWISTAEPNTPHYGCSMRIQRVDDKPFGTDLTNFQYLKIITTMYIACKKVQ